MTRIRQHSLLVLVHGISTSHAAPQVETTTANTAPPATYTANPNVGPGGSSFTDSDHFRIYHTSRTNSGTIAQSLSLLEGAHDCLVGMLKWRSSGLSFNDPSDQGGYTKTNVYTVSSLSGGAAGVMHSDAGEGMGYLDVVDSYLATPGVVVHEYGHVLHYHQRTWVDQGNTGAWWETLANWVADTFQTSELCAEARSRHGVETSSTSSIELAKLIGDSYQVIVDGSAGSGNYYQAWPFLTYLTNNPDNISGLGSDTLRQLMLQYKTNSNETPLHTLERVAGNTTAGAIVGRYWARMAYLDIQHPQAQKLFLAQRASINYVNIDAQQGSGGYKVKSARRPRYMGANIIPLKTNASAGGGGSVEVEVSASGAFTATLAVRDTGSGSVRYVALVDGAGATVVEGGEEVSLVVANTPAELVMYDAFSLSSEVSAGLEYSFTLTGATA